MKKIAFLTIITSVLILACPIHIADIDTTKDIVTLVAEENFEDCEGNQHKKGEIFAHKIDKDFMEKLYTYKSYDVRESIIKKYEQVSMDKACRIDNNCN